MEIEKQLNEALKKQNKNSIINLLSFKYFNELLIIKNNYNILFYSLFDDICNFKKEFKMFLIGLFDILDFKSYLLYKGFLKKERNSLDILFECDHINALKIKKRYSKIFKKNIEDKINDKNTLKYLSYLLSDYFFPNAKKKIIIKSLIN